MSKINTLLYQFKLLFKTTKNPISLLMYYLNLKKEVTCYLKHDGGSFDLNQENKELLGRNLFYFDQLITNRLDQKLELYKEFIKNLDNDIISIDNVKFYNNEYNPILWEYFMDNPFLRDDFAERTVIDIGANIGDTALFMANMGATVYAFEPVPETFNIAEKNVKLNPHLEDKIKLYNFAIDGENTSINIYLESEKDSATANSFQKTEKNIVVDAFTIEYILEKYTITPDILKMDCEGSEYSIILKSDLSMFNKILIEYHQEFVGKPYQVLVNRLEEMGFDINIEEMPPHNLDEFGFIIATKRRGDEV